MVSVCTSYTDVRTRSGKEIPNKDRVGSTEVITDLLGTKSMTNLFIEDHIEEVI